MLSKQASESFRVAVSGTTYAQRAADSLHMGTLNGLLTPTDREVILISDGCQSDLFADLTSAQILTAMDSYLDAARTAGADRIIVPTVVPSTGYSAPQEANRVALNAALLANPASGGADAVIDIASIPQLTDASNTTYYSDGLHYAAGAVPLVSAAYLAAGE